MAFDFNDINVPEETADIMEFLEEGNQTVIHFFFLD